MINESKKVVKLVLEECHTKGIREWGNIKVKVRDSLSDYLYGKTKRKPMILPIIMEV